jgi:hypothetical protein
VWFWWSYFCLFCLQSCCKRLAIISTDLPTVRAMPFFSIQSQCWPTGAHHDPTCEPVVIATIARTSTNSGDQTSESDLNVCLPRHFPKAGLRCYIVSLSTSNPGSIFTSFVVLICRYDCESALVVVAIVKSALRQVPALLDEYIPKRSKQIHTLNTHTNHQPAFRGPSLASPQ